MAALPQSQAPVHSFAWPAPGWHGSKQVCQEHLETIKKGPVARFPEEGVVALSYGSSSSRFEVTLCAFPIVAFPTPVRWSETGFLFFSFWSQAAAEEQPYPLQMPKYMGAA